MIYCPLTDLPKYRGLSNLLDIAIDYLALHDLAALPLGKTTIDGENIFINRFDYVTTEASADLYETHIAYIDIHLLLAGEEMIAVSSLAAHTEIQRDEAADTIGTEGRAECLCAMLPKQALLVLPGEAHRAKQQLDVPCVVQKVVCKVRMAANG